MQQVTLMLSKEQLAQLTEIVANAMETVADPREDDMLSDTITQLAIACQAAGIEAYAAY